MSRFCVNCGTEVDEDAVFCPTCGQPIDQDAEPEMAPAPAWPDPRPAAAAADDSDATRVEPLPRSETAPVPDPQPPASAPAPAAEVPSDREEPASPGPDLPLTMPVTMSGWLIGGGSALAALGALFALFDGLGSAIDIILLVVLLAVAASVFLVDRLPHIPQLRLATMAIVLVAFGVALDRLGFGRAGAGELLLFLGTAAASIGTILLETGRDQPLGGPSA